MRLHAIAAGAMLVAGQASSQSSSLSEERVRQFFDSAAEEARQLVESGDWRGLHSWHAERLTDDAKVAARATVIAADGPTFSFEASMDRETLARMAHMMEMAPRGAGAKAIEDFSLEVHVMNVTLLPDGGASAQVAFHEAGAMAMPAAAGAASGGGEPAPTGTGRIVFETATTCSMRLAVEGEETLRIRIAACEAVTTLG